MVADNPGAKIPSSKIMATIGSLPGCRSAWEAKQYAGCSRRQSSPLNMDGWRNSLDIENENLRICNHATIMPHISLSGRMHQRLKPLGCKYLLGISHQIEQSRRPHILKRLVAQTP